MRPSRYLRLLPLALATLVAAAACDDDADTLGPGDLEITVNPTALTLQAGTSEDVMVSVVRSGAFDGSLTLSAEGLPNGVSVASANVPGSQNTGTLTFFADETAAGTSADVTIRATSSGSVDEATTQLSLTVVAAAATGSFSFATDRDSVSLQPDVADTLQYLIAREGDFAGPISFLAGGMPSGLTAIFDADTVAGDTARVTLNADTTVVQDSIYTLTFTGSGDGVDDFADTVYVMVHASDSTSSGFSLTTSSDSVSLLPGGSDSVGVTVGRSGTFTGPVVFLLTGAPVGLNATLASDTVAGDTAWITLSADSTLADGEYPVVVTASGEGVEDFMDTLNVSVSATNAFRLEWDADSLNVEQNGSDSVSVLVRRSGGFLDIVSFSLDSLPSGVTATTGSDTIVALDSMDFASDSSVFTFHADSTAAPDSVYAVVVHSRSGTYTPQTDTVWISIAAPSGSGVPGGLDIVSRPRSVTTPGTAEPAWVERAARPERIVAKR